MLGHIPGALNMPIDELKQRLADLPKDREIVAYCRGPYCVFSFEAEAILRERGFKPEAQGTQDIFRLDRI